MASERITTAPTGGTGLLAVFVDLDEADKPGFRPFLAEDMFPPRRAIGFGPGASFDRVNGAGQDFATLYVAPSLGDLYGAPYQALRQKRGPRDAAYHRAFRNQDRYAAAWTGPELPPPDPGRFAPYLYVDRFALAPADVQTFNIWFACDYLPALSGIEGVLSVRRYLAMEGTEATEDGTMPAHIVLYELAAPAVADLAAWQALRDRFGDATSGLYERKLST